MNTASLMLAAMIAAAAAAPPGAARAQTAQQSQQPVTGQGKVNSVDAKAGKLNMTHGPIDAIKWPGMTMDFVVLPGVDLSGIKPGDTVTFTLGRAPDGMYAVSGITPAK